MCAHAARYCFLSAKWRLKMVVWCAAVYLSREMANRDGMNIHQTTAGQLGSLGLDFLPAGEWFCTSTEASNWFELHEETLSWTQECQWLCFSIWLGTHGIFVGNTAFKHQAHHLATCPGQHRDASINQVVPIYNMIDFILFIYPQGLKLIVKEH